MANTALGIGNTFKGALTLYYYADISVALFAVTQTYLHGIIQIYRAYSFIGWSHTSDTSKTTYV